MYSEGNPVVEKSSTEVTGEIENVPLLSSVTEEFVISVILTKHSSDGESGIVHS